MKKILTLTLTLLALVVVVAVSPSVSAQTREELINDGKCQSGDNRACISETPDPAVDTTCRGAEDCNIVSRYLNPFINFLAIMVGVSVTIGIIIGGIQYAGSSGDPGKVQAAKNRIRNSIVALIAFFFLYALLRFLIPGEGLIG